MRWATVAAGRARSRALLAGIAAAGLAIGTMAVGEAEPVFVPGRGAARAVVLSAGPAQAGLAVAVDVAESMADFQVSVGRGTSTSVGSGVLGLVAPDVLGYLPQPTRVASTDEGSAEGHSLVFPENPAGAPMGLTRQEAWASDEPSGRSRTTVGALDVPGLVRLGGAQSQAVSGVVDGDTRESIGMVHIPSVELLDGMVRLEGLRWMATQRSGGSFPDDVEEETTFSVGRVVLAGEELATPATPAEATAALNELGAALGATGMSIEAPGAGRDGARTVVTPLVVRIAGGPVSRQLLAPALAAAQPVRDELTAALFEVTPEAGAAVLVADIALGPLTGSGSLVLELGGAEATTDGTIFENPLAGVRIGSGGPVGAAALPVGTRPAADAASQPARFAAPGSNVALSPSPATAGEAVPARASTVGGGDSDGRQAAAGVAAAGLAVALVLAGAEWARVRRQRFLFAEED